MEKMQTPQQKNGYDCGLYLLSISEYVANEFIGKHASIKQVVTSESVSALRKAIKDHILSFKLAQTGGSLFGLSKKKKKETTPAPATTSDSTT